jgi:hypothetical protein
MGRDLVPIVASSYPLVLETKAPGSSHQGAQACLSLCDAVAQAPPVPSEVVTGWSCLKHILLERISIHGEHLI